MKSRDSHDTDKDRYREILTLVVDAATSYAIITADEDGLIFSWSRGAEALLGWSAAEMIGQPLATFFTPEDREAGVPAREMAKARADGLVNDERWHLKRGGGRFWAMGELFALSRGDECVGFAKIIKDRTKEKQVQDRLDAAQGEVLLNAEQLTVERKHLETAERRWRVLFDQMQEGFFVAEEVSPSDERPRDFRLVELNPAFETITGLKSSETIRHTIRESFPDPDELISLCSHVLDTGSFVQKELFLPSLRARWYKARLSRTGPNRLAGLLLDISTGRAAEAALREETQTLETLNRSGVALAAELDTGRVIEIVTDAAVAMTGAEFGAFFYDAQFSDGRPYVQLQSDEAPKDLFLNAIELVSSNESGDAIPEASQGAGQFIGSLIAIPILTRSGEPLARLFLGDRRQGVLGDRAERLLEGLAAQASVALDNARLFQSAQREIEQRQRAEDELRVLNETLEQRIDQALAERDYAEDQLRQAQKMEAIGQLTGGIAHDFNNLLTVVSGNIDMVKRALGGDVEGRTLRAIDNALKGVSRAAALTQRLLAFARRQPLQPEAVDVNRLINGMSDLLRRSLSETIVLDTEEGEDLWLIEVDPNQLENALLNLAVNASDAMPDGGRLRITTSNMRVETPHRPLRTGVTPGDYVVIVVADSGSGMSEEVLANAFDPFYTTKQVGKGTGLGLSQVYGFVKQSGGHVKITSRIDEGTSVSIFLPRLFGDRQVANSPERPAPEPAQAGECILVVEDDEDVRRFTVDSLVELGYRVIEALDGATAIELLADDAEGVRMLLTDVVMPTMSGRELADRAVAIRPSLRVLFTTGYPRDAIVHDGCVDPGVALLPKPFSFPDLAAKVREVLDAEDDAQAI